MKNKKIALNASLSILQVVLMGISSFIVYKMVLDKLGPELLGVWSLVFSISSVANIANLGVASSLVKFIAVYHKDENWKKINQLVGTGFCVVAGLMSIVVLLLYLCRDSVLSFLLKDNTSELGKLILPLSLLSLWINTVGAIFLAVLDGFKETYLKNILYIVSSLLFIVFTFLFIPQYGILGLGYAQILQGLIILLGSLVLVVKYDSNIYISTMTFNKSAFKEIFSYSFKFQIVTLISIIIEPITKFYLLRFGSLSAVGYFEMANKLVVQARQVLVSANQVIVPFIAQKESSKEYIVGFYKTNFSIISICSLLIMGSLAISIPLISLLWVGREEPFFIVSAITLSFAHIINLHTIPANFTNLGTGNINHLIYTTLVICVLTCILGAVLGFYFANVGVLYGWAIAVIIGSLFQMYLFRKKYQIEYKQLYDSDFIRYIIIFIIVEASVLVIIDKIHNKFLWLSTILGLLILIVYLSYFIRNNVLLGNLKKKYFPKLIS